MADQANDNEKELETQAADIPVESQSDIESDSQDGASLSAKDSIEADTDVKAKEQDQVIPEYTPNYKFKAYDKEYEFDEFLRDAVKNKEQEEKLREIYAKAYGLDDLKTKYESTKEFKNKYSELQNGINYLEQTLNAGDYESFFKALKIDEKNIMKYVLDRINYQEMDDNQKKEYDSNLNARREAINYQTQLMQMQEQFNSLQTQQLSNELESALSDPEIHNVAKIYDDRVGVNGAFREAVLKRGDFSYNQTGKYESPRKIALELADGLKKLIGPLEAQVSPQGPSLQQSIAAKQSKPVIPNINAKTGNSPAKRNINSIADLEKLAEEMSRA